MALYGYQASEEILNPLPVKPVLSLKTRVNALRSVPAQTSVSYGRHYYTSQATTIATLPIGYGDGFMRCLSHKAECLIQGKRYPIVGVICMDECMVDIGDDPIKIGDEVILIGHQEEAKITAVDLAQQADSIPYEILSAISGRVPRIST